MYGLESDRKLIFDFIEKKNMHMNSYNFLKLRISLLLEYDTSEHLNMALILIYILMG